MFLLAAWVLLPTLGNYGLWLPLLLLMATPGLGLGLLYWRLERGAGFVVGSPASS